jgi:putative MATE family efflux protein
MLFVAMPLIAVGFFLASALRGAGDTRTPMFAALVMGALTLFLSYGLILGKFGLPRLETIGAALAIDGAFFAFSLILTLLFVFDKTILRLPRRGWKPDWELGRAIFRIGIPSAAEWVLIQFGLLIYIKVVSYYGESAAAGYFIGFALIGLAQTPAFGFQTAAATLVGQSVGARRFDRAEAAFRHCVILGFVFMAAAGVALQLLSLPGAMSWLFPKLTPESIEFARTFNLLLLIVMPLMGASFTMAGGRRGAGDTIVPLIGSSIGVYGGRLALAFLLYFLLKPPIIIIWCSMYPDILLRIGVMAFRVRSGRWKTGRIHRMRTEAG